MTKRDPIPTARRIMTALVIILALLTGGCSFLIELECEGDTGCGQVATAGENTAGEDTAGEDTAGEDTAGEDTAGEDTAGEDTAGEDTAGEDTAGEDTAGEDTAGEDTAGEDTAGSSPLEPEIPYHELECPTESCQLTWVQIDAGVEYQVGSDVSFSEDERPARLISVSVFDVSTTEVTVGQYSRCVEAGTCPIPTRIESGDERQRCAYFEVDAWDKPMNCITYCEALSFVSWAQEQVEGVRIPSEAEWMYIAQDQGRSAYPWGDDPPSCERAQLYQCEPKEPRSVCTPDPSNGAVCDLIGNVSEWVADHYRDSYRDAPLDQSPVPFEGELVCNDQGVATLTRLEVDGETGEMIEVEVSEEALLQGIVKGGGWRSTTSAARPTNRSATPLNTRSDQVGFRVVKPIGS